MVYLKKGCEGTDNPVSDPKPLPKLNPRHPRAYLAVLGWALVDPHRMYRYRQTHGDAELQYIGVWLTMVLLWIPLLIPFVAHVMNLVPLNDTIATTFIVLFPISIFYVQQRSDLAGALLCLLFFFMHAIDKSATDGNTTIAFVAHFSLITAFSVAVVVSNATVEPPFPSVAFLILVAGVGAWVAWHVGGNGFLRGFVVGGFVSALWAPLSIETGIRLRRIYRRGGWSPLPFVAVFLTIVGILALVWLYLLGGWHHLA